MIARRRVLDLGPLELKSTLLAVLGTLVFTLVAVDKFGLAGLLAPLGAVVVLLLLMRPVLAVMTVVFVVVLAEGGSFGFFVFTAHLYQTVSQGVSPVDLMVVVVVLSVLIDLLRTRRPLRVPSALVLPLVFLALAMACGWVMGTRVAGLSALHVIVTENVLFYVLLLPLAIYNLDLDRRTIRLMLGATFVLAIVKALLGLAEIASGKGAPIEGTGRLTYFEPLPNWLVMMAILVVFAAIIMRAKPPRWMLISLPFLVACLVLSYRRSFWIGLVLSLLLVLLLGSRPVGRRMLLPVALLVVGAVWLLGSIHFQSQSPITKRITSLQPSKIQTNADDRYRLDERANVLGEIKQHPLTGLGVGVAWTATVRPLPQEHKDGRQYVHFAALWWWLKLGILGLAAYVSIIAAALLISFRVWRRMRDPLLSAFGLASLCGFVALIVLDTTASFTGVEQRFTVVFGVQLGLLALLAAIAEDDPETTEAAPA